VAAGGWDGDIGVWDVATGQLRGSVLRGHLSAVHRLAFSEDNKTLISSGNFSTRFWNLMTGQETLHFEDTIIPAPVQLLQTAWRPGKRWLSLFGRTGMVTLSPMAKPAANDPTARDSRY
jgi:WD40 repeat protein